MDAIRLEGHIHEEHRLLAQAPGSIPPGPVTVWIVPASDEDDAGSAWMDGIAHQWADELSDDRQAIYTQSDGKPVHES